MQRPHIYHYSAEQTANILPRYLARVTNNDIISELKGHYRDHKLAVAYRSQLKARIQLRDDSLQELAVAKKPLDHYTLASLPGNFIQKDAACAFVDGLRDHDAEQLLLIISKRPLPEALNQALKLQATKDAVGPPAKLQNIWARAM
jgi:hypothetical protein